MLPNANDLKFFLTVANTLNLSRASERIGISQPALTMAIKRLEECVKAQLIIRQKTGVQLTKQGFTLVHLAQELLQMWDELTNDIHKDDKEIRGTYSIGLHPSVAIYTLEYFLPNLLIENSNLYFKLIHDLSRNITEDVISHKIDFGIVVNPIQHPDLMIKEIYKDKVTFWTSKNKNINNDIENPNAVLLYDPELLQSQTLLKKLPKKNILNRSVTSSNLEVITEMTGAGCGIGILPTRVALKSKTKLSEIANFPFYQDSISLIHRADRQKNLAGKKIKEAILKSLAGH